MHQFQNVPNIAKNETYYLFDKALSMINLRDVYYLLYDALQHDENGIRLEVYP